jgi:hypothetical protein
MTGCVGGAAQDRSLIVPCASLLTAASGMGLAQAFRHEGGECFEKPHVSTPASPEDLR